MYKKAPLWNCWFHKLSWCNIYLLLSILLLFGFSHCCSANTLLLLSSPSTSVCMHDAESVWPPCLLWSRKPFIYLQVVHVHKENLHNNRRRRRWLWVTARCCTKYEGARTRLAATTHSGDGIVGERIILQIKTRLNEALSECWASSGTSWCQPWFYHALCPFLGGKKRGTSRSFAGQLCTL